MRKVSFQSNYVMHPAGSCLAVFGNTKVICTASISDDLPPFLQDSDSGWLTAEYAMLPGSTGGGRKRRDFLKRDGRSTEIQRLIARSLRMAVNLEKLGPVSIIVDCDVLQADGGTRTAAISGGWVALYEALKVLAKEQGVSGPEHYVLGQVAAVSVGIVEGDIVCDLDYKQDSTASTDMNIVQRDSELIEVQGTAERNPFSRESLLNMLDEAANGIQHIFGRQQDALGLSP